MPQIINTNLASLTAQNALNNTQGSLNTAMQRLSTGLRINSAADDAAGLAIVTGMQSQINGDTVAERNANDGISMAQTAGSALSQITNDLQTIRQLAVQSANATNTAANRQQINTEVTQEINEVSRISQQTTFNGLSLLTGQSSMENATFQIGADVGQVINMNFGNGTEANQIGGLATASTGLSGLFGSITLGATDLAVTAGGGSAVDVAGGTYTSAQQLADAINTAAASSISGAGTADATANSNVASVNSSGNIVITNDSTANGVTFTAAAGNAALTNLGVQGAAKEASAGTPTVADSTGTLPSTLTLGSGDFTLQGVSIQGTFSSAQDLVAAINAQGISGVSAYLDSSNNLQVTSQSALTVGGAKAGTGASDLGFAAGDLNTPLATSGSLAGIDVNTVDHANVAIATVDSAIAQVSNLQSSLGAMQNRFDSVVSNLQSGSQNLSASQSSIQDADFASETAKLSQAQILQQAGISMLAQANSQPQLVLKLLQ